MRKIKREYNRQKNQRKYIRMRLDYYRWIRKVRESIVDREEDVIA